MKITIEVPDAAIDAALAAPHSRYWAKKASWHRYPEGAEGFVLEHSDLGRTGKPERIMLGSSKLKAALTKMAETQPARFARVKANEADGVDGDILLQLMAFGEVKYG